MICDVRPLQLILLSAMILAVIPAAAGAQTASYRGPHPVDLDGHWHLEDAPHEHAELVVGPQPFGEADGLRLFLGDPIAFGWDGEVWMYRGAHPLPGGVPGYCAIPGAHRHVFAPEGRFRRASNGAHVYIGGLRGGVAMVRPERTVPRRPVVVAPAIASPAPYWFWGCQYQLLPGDRGALLPTALVPGCELRSPGGPTGAGRASGGSHAAAARPTSRGSWFDGNYTHRRSVDGRPARGGPPSRQRR